MQRTFIVILGILILVSIEVFSQQKKNTTKTLLASQTTNIYHPGVQEKKEDLIEKMTDEEAMEMVTQQLEAASIPQATTSTPITDENRIFTVVETSAQFPGGTVAVEQFISSNLQYPKTAKKENITGKVYARFLIEKDGKISEVQILRGLGHGCDEEAIRVIKAMPAWKPARQRETIVRSYHMLQINFTLP